MTWLAHSGQGRTQFERVFDLRPDLHADFDAFADLLWTRSGLDPALLELCRLRVAQVLGCDAEPNRAVPGVSAEKLAALGAWSSSTAFSPLEAACLAVADKFVLDPRGVSDADAAALTAHLSPAHTVALIEALAVFDGFTRFRAILGVGAST